MKKFLPTTPAGPLLFALLLIALIFACANSLMVGPYGWSLDIWYNQTPTSRSILQYRLIRTLLALVAGSSLAASGASLQAIFRNSLADPHLFGVSGGAALGASVVIAFYSNTSYLAPSIGAMAGGMGAFLLIFTYLQASRSGSLSHCLLVGILINSMAAALITVLKTTMPSTKTQALLFWLVGHLSVIETSSLLFIIPLWAIGLAMLWKIKGELEVLSFGIEEGQILGVDTKRVIKLAVIANCILIGNVVSFAGMIGFLGLVVPHFVRITCFSDYRLLLPASTLLGALLLVVFETTSRLSFCIAQTELPIGSLSALFLSPVFFVLLLRTRNNG